MYTSQNSLEHLQSPSRDVQEFLKFPGGFFERGFPEDLKASIRFLGVF